MFSVILMVVMLMFKMAPAEELISTIPKIQTPLARTFPPAPTEQTSAGTGKFVIFTREETGKSNEWDFIAGAWECIPSRPDVPITKRIEFCHSSWNAEPLLDGLVRDGSYGLLPRFVQLQVDAGNYEYSVNLYDINYRTWETRCIWQGNFLDAFGLMKNFIFCRSSRDSSMWFQLDAASGTIIKDAPFIPTDVYGLFWLVRKTGEQSGLWSFNTITEQYAGHFGEIEKIRREYSKSLLSSDGKNRALLRVPLKDAWTEGAIEGILVLQRDGQPEDIRVPVQMEAKSTRGSGLPWPIGTRLNFVRDEKLEFSAIQPSGRMESVWTIDIVSGKTARSTRPASAATGKTNALFNGVPAPDYLRPYLKDFQYHGRCGLAPAFLVYLGVLKKEPECPDYAAGVSRNGRHVLFKAKSGPLANEFIYGDLQTKKIVRWKCPAGIKPGDCMEFAWVETP